MTTVSSVSPRPAVSLVRLLVGEVKIVGALPEGPVLLCGNHVSYRDVFLFGLIRSSARLLVHPLVFSFPFLKKYALRWGFVQVSIDDAVALLKQGQTVAICPTGLVEALGEASCRSRPARCASRSRLACRWCRSTSITAVTRAAG